MARFGRTYVKLGLVRPVTILGVLFLETKSDTEGLTDSTSFVQTHVQNPADTEGLTDSLAFVQTEISSFSDTAGLTDSLVLTLGTPFNPSDAEGLTDNLSTAITARPTLADSMGLTDSLILTTPAAPVDPFPGYDSRLVLGPGTVYLGAYGAVEPSNALVASAPDSGVWTDVGGLLGGVELVVEQEWIEVTVKQNPWTPMRRLKKRKLTIKTQMAEPTLANLAYALNDTTATSSGSGWGAYTPSDQTEGTVLTYNALIIDGWAPGIRASDRRHKRRRIIVRKALSIDNVQFAYSKDGQSVFTVSWACHYVDGTTPPFRVIDEA